MVQFGLECVLTMKILVHKFQKIVYVDKIYGKWVYMYVLKVNYSKNLLNLKCSRNKQMIVKSTVVKYFQGFRFDLNFTGMRLNTFHMKQVTLYMSIGFHFQLVLLLEWWHICVHGFTSKGCFKWGEV